MGAFTADLRKVFPNAKADILAGCIADQGVLDEYGITDTAQRLKFFLSQVGHESGGLTIREENLRYSAKRMTEVWPRRFPTVASAKPYANNPRKLAEKTYGGRMGNGPEGSGDGYRYRGQGGIQITGKEAYEVIGEIAGLDLVNNPELASDPKHYLRIACAFWKWKGLNALCDKGDFRAVTKRINGGYTGLADRKEWLDRVSRHVVAGGKAPESTGAGGSSLSKGSRGTKVSALQARLVELGYVVKVDGDFGNRTRDAVLAFQADNDLPTSGVVDDDTWEVLDQAERRPTAPERAAATVADLREEGSRIIGNADLLKTGAAVTAVVGGGTAVSEKAPVSTDPTSWLTVVSDMLEPLKAIREFVSSNSGLLILGVAVGVWFVARRIQQARVEDKRTGKTV